MKKAGRERSHGNLPHIPHPTYSQRTKLPHTGFSRVHLPLSHRLVETPGKTRALKWVAEVGDKHQSCVLIWELLRGEGG